MTIVLKVSSSVLAQLANHYTTGPQSDLPKGTNFRAKLPGVTITAYNSGKVMFQGQLAEQEANRWSSIANLQPAVHKSSQTKAIAGLPPHFAELAVVGSDEVGTGSYFGPLTTAAVFVDHDHLAPLRHLGVEDSKKLTDPAIIKMAKQIMAECPYHVVNVKPVDYNRLIQKYNQAQLKAICHNYVLNQVLTKIVPTKPDAILIDQFVKPQTYFNYLQDQSPIIRQHVFFKEKGESYHLAVAAASIVARYVSLTTMDELSTAAGMTLPIGAGLKVDQIAAKLIHQGKDLKRFAKLHFANTAKAQQLANQLN